MSSHDLHAARRALETCLSLLGASKLTSLGGIQVAGSLQDSSLAVMLRRFDEGVKAQFEGVTSTWPTSMRTLHRVLPGQVVQLDVGFNYISA